MNKEAREIVKKGKKLGWSIVRQGKHVIMRCGHGCHQVSVPGTPGRRSCSMRDTLSLFRKCVA